MTAVLGVGMPRVLMPQPQREDYRETLPIAMDILAWKRSRL
jgi:hypothetical protein